MTQLTNNDWSDPSPHRSETVTVNNIALHYLDWRGEGEPLLFLHGLGDSAHIFDGLAPRLSDKFRVLALTRRGHGQSDKPESGYDLATLAEDIRGFLDALNISQVNLAGHSIGGDEATAFVGRYPERVKRLIYLDVYLERPWLNDEKPDPLADSPPTPDDFASLDSIREWIKRQVGFWSDAQEANLRAALALMPDGSVRVGIPKGAGMAIIQSVADFQPEAPVTQSPTLAFFAVAYTHPRLAAAPDEATRAAAQAYIDHYRGQQLAAIELFKRLFPQAETVEAPDAHHHLFIQQPAEIAAKIQEFLLAE
jgi:non-heme chloroperoxidase